MTAFVDPTDSAAVEQVLRAALAGIGPAGLLSELSSVLPVRLGREGGLFRQGQPTVIQVGEEALSIPARGRPALQHVVGGVVLSSDEVAPSALPGVLAALVMRSLAETGAHDAASVLLTSLRDALAAGR
ncbi:MAG: hypothetical protein JWM02_3047 [Frankiales bacterium]|nr:hypothetical protein [Frankiales bacterium]